MWRAEKGEHMPTCQLSLKAKSFLHGEEQIIGAAAEGMHRLGDYAAQLVLKIPLIKLHEGGLQPNREYRLQLIWFYLG